MTYPNPISSPYVLFKPMSQPLTRKEIKALKRALIEDAWFNQEISDDQLKAEYDAWVLLTNVTNYHNSIIICYCIYNRHR